MNFYPLKIGENEINSKEIIDNNNSLYNSDFCNIGKFKNFPKLNTKKLNQSFRGGSNNLINRNYLSVNNRNFDNLQCKFPKKLSTILHQTFEENNYLEPLKSFRYEHKNDVPDYAMNKEMYNITKKKLFNNEVKSNIRLGKPISRIDYLNRKKKLLNINDKNISSSNDSINIREKFYDKIKKYENPINIKEKINAEKENICDNLIKEKFLRKKLIHNISAKRFEPINPNDSKTEELNCNRILIRKNCLPAK